MGMGNGRRKSQTSRRQADLHRTAEQQEKDAHPLGFGIKMQNPPLHLLKAAGDDFHPGTFFEKRLAGLLGRLLDLAAQEIDHLISHGRGMPVKGENAGDARGAEHMARLVRMNKAGKNVPGKKRLGDQTGHALTGRPPKSQPRREYLDLHPLP